MRSVSREVWEVHSGPWGGVCCVLLGPCHAAATIKTLLEHPNSAVWPCAATAHLETEHRLDKGTLSRYSTALF